MKEDLLKIIKTYGVLPQLKHFQSEVWELNEVILQYEHINDYDKTSSNFKVYGNNLMKEHIAEEIADVLNMLEQFMYYYEIDIYDVIEIKHQKVARQLKRMEKGE